MSHSEVQNVADPSHVPAQSSSNTVPLEPQFPSHPLILILLHSLLLTHVVSPEFIVKPQFVKGIVAQLERALLFTKYMPPTSKPFEPSPIIEVKLSVLTDLNVPPIDVRFAKSLIYAKLSKLMKAKSPVILLKPENVFSRYDKSLAVICRPSNV